MDGGNGHHQFPAEITIEPIGAGRTRMSIESVFPDAAAMEQLLAMGMEQGWSESLERLEAELQRMAG